MNKSERMKSMGLRKYDSPDMILCSKFDINADYVWRAIYTDDKGERYAWLWGEFYPLRKVACGYMLK